MATKSLPLKGLLTRTMEYDVRQWDVQVPEGFTVSDLLRPECWNHHSTTLRPRDLVWCEAVDGSYDIILRVKAVAKGGVVMRLVPFCPMEDEDEAAAPAPTQPRMIGDKPVPRVEYTRGTKWRGIGLDGNEIFRDKATKEEADSELARWAKALNIELTT